MIVFEGRAAGKGGTIRALTERVSPRIFRVIALPAPSDREVAAVPPTLHLLEILCRDLCCNHGWLTEDLRFVGVTPRWRDLIAYSWEQLWERMWEPSALVMPEYPRMCPLTL